MKIRPIVLCGGAGTRLWPDQKNYQAKQFINFGGWTLISKTLDRIKNPIFEITYGNLTIDRNAQALKSLTAFKLLWVYL